MTSVPKRVWLITGCSTGLGLSLVRVAIAAGEHVIASSRNPRKTPALVAEVEASGNKWIPLDVAATDFESRLQDAVSLFGRIDVLVNNAGFAQGGALEDVPVEAIHAQFETNFYGPLRAIKTLLPHMRGNGSGTIVNVTSTNGHCPLPGAIPYDASKHALEGLSEALAGEVAAFGIRVLIVEPGSMRTEFFSDNNIKAAPVSEPYKGTAVDAVMNALMSMRGTEALDPDRAAQAIVDVVLGRGSGEKHGQTLRLPLGKEAGEKIGQKGGALVAMCDSTRDIWANCDFPN